MNFPIDAQWTFTLSLHLAWLWLYFLVGLVIFLPANWFAHRRVPDWRRQNYWRWMATNIRKRPFGVVVLVALWPAVLWELLR